MFGMISKWLKLKFQMIHQADTETETPSQLPGPNTYDKHSIESGRNLGEYKGRLGF